MTTNLKKSVAGVMMLFSFVPALALAEDTTGTAGTPVVTSATTSPDGVKTVQPNNFCSRISTIQTKSADALMKLDEKTAKNEAARLDKIANKESNTDAKRAEGRSDVDAKRVKNWNSLASKAKTDVQKAAVEAYKTAITNAVTIRRTSVDAAVKVYRDALAVAMTTRNTALNQAVTTFKVSMDAALSKAKADCTANVSSKTVKDTYNKSVSDARKALQAARKTANTAMGIPTLKKTRNDGVRAAEVIFKTATDKARADLLLALK